MPTVLAFIGRILIALLFIASGIGKLADPASTAQMLAAVGLPTGLAVPTGLFELIAGLALVFGVLTRLFAVLLAGFCLAAAFFFHNNFTDPMQAAMLLKNVAIAGGLLCLTAVDSLRWSYDAMRERRRSEIAAQDAVERQHEAELRAARVEGTAAARTTAAHSIDRTVVTDVDGDGVPEVRKRRWF